MTQDQFQIHVVDCLARLETKMTGLVGNGQPGRVTKLESDVEDLKKARWKLMGAFAAISAFVSAVFHFFIK